MTLTPSSKAFIIKKSVFVLVSSILDASYYYHYQFHVGVYVRYMLYEIDSSIILHIHSIITTNAIGHTYLSTKKGYVIRYVPFFALCRLAFFNRIFKGFTCSKCWDLARWNLDFFTSLRISPLTS